VTKQFGMIVSFSLNVGQQKEDSLSRIDDINTKAGDGPHHEARANLMNSCVKEMHYKPGGGATVNLALARDSTSTFIGSSPQTGKAPVLSWSSPPLWVE